MWLDVFLNSSTKFIILSQFSLSNYNLMVKNTQVGLINHICLSFYTYIHFSREEEEEDLFRLFLQARESGEWGAYDALTPTQKLCVFLHRCRGGCCVGKYYSFWCGLILTKVMVACRLTIFVFQPPRHLCTMSLGGYCRL